MGRRRNDDEISVAELLRETGATPRSLGDAPGTAAVREEDTGDGYRERLEQRAREAAAHQQRAGRRIRWISALGGAVVVVGSLVLIAVTSESSPGRQATAAESLAPATTPRSTTPKPTPTPIPTVLRQTASATSTTPAAPPPAPASTPVQEALCTVRYSVTDQWDTGFTAGVAVTNRGRQTLSPWTLTWTFTAGQRVTHSWNGDFAQSGGRVTMDAVSYNVDLAPGGTVEIGFNGAFDHGNPAPTGFTLNGSRCGAG
ncbi:cellulose-binding domain-containing protein [Amycolatopsis sp. FBCC-B4732]|uniref:cellulose-binding domain-containing protein n=1 Tax=Amycolatopsis sp. FBCC-B4732 TaxID=3079339 RepID=UPI001FF1B47B|nr:cellulose-binding domain-containing protein [Amycolatopsis sp. FBCC-B4732]UOX90341.1 cellulose-binding domain-containing protein [Amycolatopsis sp. FBCC-B4732]